MHADLDHEERWPCGAWKDEQCALIDCVVRVCTGCGVVWWVVAPGFSREYGCVGVIHGWYGCWFVLCEAQWCMVWYGGLRYGVCEGRTATRIACQGLGWLRLLFVCPVCGHGARCLVVRDKSGIGVCARTTCACGKGVL